MSRLLVILLFFISVTDVAEAGVFEDSFDREQFIQDAVCALDERILENERLTSIGRLADLEYVVDIRNVHHRRINPIGNASKLNADLTAFKQLYAQEGAAIYVLFSTIQPHFMADAWTWTDNSYFDQYLKEVKNSSLDQWLTYNDPAHDKWYDDYQAEIIRITDEVADRSLLGYKTKKGALLHLCSSVRMTKNTAASATNLKLVYEPIIALGQDLKASSVRSMLTYINSNRAKYILAGATPKIMYDGDPTYNGLADPHIRLLKETFVKLFNNEFLADETESNIDAMLIFYPNETTNSVIIGKLNQYVRPSSVRYTKTVNNVTVVMDDYAGISQSDPKFWDGFLKIGDKNGLTLNDIHGQTDEKVSYYIVTTSETNKVNDKTSIQIVMENNFTCSGDGDYCMVMAMHFRNATSSGALPVQVYSQMSPDLKELVNDYREDHGYAWYRNKTTGDIVYGKNLSWEWVDGRGVSTDWVYLDEYRYTDAISAKVVYNKYSNNFFVGVFMSTVDRSFTALDEYMMENGEVVGMIVIEGAITLALAIPTGGGSLLYAGGRIIAYQTGKEIAKEVSKGMLFGYAINAGLNMLITDKEIGDPGYYESVYYTEIDKVGVIAAGIEEIFASDGAKALVNCVGGAGSAAIKDNMEYIDLPKGCVENVMVYYLTKNLMKGGSVIFSKIKKFAADHPSTFAQRLRQLYSFSETQINDLFDYLGVPRAAQLSQLMTILDLPALSSLKSKYAAMTPAMKAAFEADFENATEAYLRDMQQNDNLYNAWKNFRSKYPTRILCN